MVQTRSDIYDNQIIESMPTRRDPTQYDVLTVDLNLKQVQFVTAQYVALFQKIIQIIILKKEELNKEMKLILDKLR